MRAIATISRVFGCAPKLTPELALLDVPADPLLPPSIEVQSITGHRRNTMPSTTINTTPPIISGRYFVQVAAVAFLGWPLTVL
jgi:hypothetical protein